MRADGERVGFRATVMQYRAYGTSYMLTAACGMRGGNARRRVITKNVVVLNWYAIVTDQFTDDSNSYNAITLCEWLYYSN